MKQARVDPINDVSVKAWSSRVVCWWPGPLGRAKLVPQAGYGHPLHSAQVLVPQSGLIGGQDGFRAAHQVVALQVSLAL